MRIVPIAAAVFALASPAVAVTYNVYDVDPSGPLVSSATSTAPGSGGALTSA